MNYVCNLLIPGAAKSGTSALHEVLAQHPKISMSRVKEPHHFTFAGGYGRGPAKHNALFEDKPGAEYFGESSTGYMVDEDALDRIKSALKDPKIIILLRHPIERAISHYRYRFVLGLEKRPLLEALRTDGYTFTPEAPPSGFGYTGYLRFSKYSKYIPLWIEAFGAANVLLIDSNRLRRTQQDAIDECIAFLGLEPFRCSAQIFDNATDDAHVLLPEPLRKLRAFIPDPAVAPLRPLATKLLRKVSPSPPQTLTAEEEELLNTELAEDVRLFERVRHPSKESPPGEPAIREARERAGRRN